MKDWKLLLGVGAACAVCCAAPIAAGIAWLFAGGAGALLAYAGGLLPMAVALGMVATVAAVWLLRRRRMQRLAPSCGCSSTPRIQEVRHASR